MTDKTKQIDELKKKIPERERRVIPTELGTVELRTAEGESPKIAMFVPYNKRSVEIMGFTEIIAPGFFTRSVKNGKTAKRNNDIVALWQHDPSWVLGRQANDTLTFDDTKAGMNALVELDGEDPMHRHFARRVERRDVTGTSFGFTTVKDEWEYDDDGNATRTLVEGRIFDFSPVTYPAYPDSDSEARERRSVEVAAVRMGLDVGALASLIAGAQGGKVAQEAAAEVRSWVAKLTGLIPEPPVPVVDWKAKLALRERALRSMANV